MFHSPESAVTAVTDIRFRMAQRGELARDHSFWSHPAGTGAGATLGKLLHLRGRTPTSRSVQSAPVDAGNEPA